VRRLLAAHVKLSEKLLAANVRYHTREINFSKRSARRGTKPGSLDEFSFLKLMETLIMMNVVAVYKLSWSGKKVFTARCEAIHFALQVRIFQEVSPTNYLLVFTNTCKVFFSHSGWPYSTSIKHNSVKQDLHSLVPEILESIWYKNGLRKPN
jgi:hypothetical protein